MSEVLGITPSSDQEAPEQPQNNPEQQRSDTMNYDPKHEINVALRAIQEETMAKIAREFGPEAAERFETKEDWSEWPTVLGSEDIIAKFREKYDIFVAEQIAKLEQENKDSHLDQAA